MKNKYNKQSKYDDKVIDGYLCTFNSNNHRCVAVLLATGMNIEKWIKFSDKIIGTKDSDNKKTEKILFCC